MARKIRGMTVMIVGASSGIGLALAHELDERSARLILAARRSQRLERLNRKLGGRHLIAPVDVTSARCVANLMQACDVWCDRLDTIVVNSGFGEIRSVGECDAEQARAMFETNVLGTLECIHAAVERMKKQSPRDGYRGQIVVVSSAAARRAVPMFGVYSATKAAQLSIAEALRVEIAPLEISVTSVHPIGTESEFLRTAMRRSGARPPRRTMIEYRQSAREVAAKIADGIESPRPEVWTSLRFRLLMNLATFFPAITDRIMSRRLRPRKTSTDETDQRRSFLPSERPARIPES